MKLSGKITLTTIATIIGIIAASLTAIEKGIIIFNKAIDPDNKRVIRNENELKENGVEYADITNHDTDRKTGRKANKIGEE